MNAPAAPRLRLLAALGMALAVTAIDNVRMLAVVVVLAGLGWLAVWLACADARARLWRPLPALALFLLLVGLSVPLERAAGRWVWSSQGQVQALAITLRCTAAVLASGALLARMDAFTLARTAMRLGLPPRLGLLLVLMVRHLQTLRQTWKRIDLAMRARGFVARSDARTYVVRAHQVALVLVHALLRAERVQQALSMRGFAAAKPAGEPAPARCPLGDDGHD